MTDHRDDPANQGRRHALECMLWAGAGVLWTVAGGVPRSSLIAAAAAAEPAARPRRRAAGLRFVQISDSHIGFKNPPNADTPGTLQAAIGPRPRPDRSGAAIVLHTGDVSHLSKPAEFDTARADHRGGRPRRALRARRARRAGG